MSLCDYNHLSETLYSSGFALRNQAYSVHRCLWALYEPYLFFPSFAIRLPMWGTTLPTQAPYRFLDKNTSLGISLRSLPFSIIRSNAFPIVFCSAKRTKSEAKSNLPPTAFLDIVKYLIFNTLHIENLNIFSQIHTNNATKTNIHHLFLLSLLWSGEMSGYFVNWWKISNFAPLFL